MRAAIATVLLLASGACWKDPARPGPDPAAVAELDALWALAPEGAFGGIAISHRGIAMLEGSLGALQAALAAAPDLAEPRREIEAALRAVLGISQLTRGELGLATDRGAALFAIEDDTVAVLPVADRDRFLARVRGTKGSDGDRIGPFLCKPVRDRYVCAEKPQRFERLGRGDLRSRLAAAGSRGDIEIAGERGDVQLAAALQLERGAGTLRGAVRLKAGADRFGRLATPPARPRLDPARPTGFVVANITRFVEDVPPIPVGNTTLEAVARSLEGPVTVSTSSGPFVFDLQQSLSDPGPARALLERCPELLGPARVQATSSGGVCRVTVPMIELQLEASVTGKTLRIATRPAPGKAVPMTALGKELAAGEWTFASWGRGTIYGSGEPMLRGLRFGMRDDAPDRVALVLRAWAMLNELGMAVRVEGDTVRFVVGIRTGFANPDAVVAELNAVPTRQIADGTAVETARRIAASSPGAPLGADLEAGGGGNMAGYAAIGILAAIAIPMFMDSMKVAKKPEALIQLDKIGKRAVLEYNTNATFPRGTAPLTPAVPCCSFVSSKKKCPVDPAAWATPEWRALDFSLDAPHYYQYSYVPAADGQSFIATATGDLDCDGTSVTYTLEGKSIGGTPRITITEPPPNSD